jgi:hypothetical protein
MDQDQQPSLTSQQIGETYISGLKTGMSMLKNSVDGYVAVENDLASHITKTDRGEAGDMMEL